MSSITHYRPWTDGTVRVIDRPMSPSQRDYAVGEGLESHSRLRSFRDDNLTAHRVDTTTRDGATLRVDWLAENGRAYAWFVEEGEAPRKGPESYGTIWVCQCCMLTHANGECCSLDETGHSDGCEPLSAIQAPFHVAMGMAYEEHAEDCMRNVLGRIDEPVADDYECDCETDTYSTSQCAGCGSYLHGERHAMTLFKG